MESSDKGSLIPKASTDFTTTQWSMVLAAGDLGTPAARDALAALCQRYWYPLYAFVRRRGSDAEEAADLTQGFFTSLMESNDIAGADRARGRFRAWLLGSLKHFMAKEWRARRALKRGGGRALLSIDTDEAEKRYLLEPSHELTPERIFERRWALTLLTDVLNELRAESVRDSREALFDALKDRLAGGLRQSYVAIADELGMSEGAVKTAAHRLRRRYQALLRSAIMQTVSGEEEVEEEIRGLFEAVGSGS